MPDPNAPSGFRFVVEQALSSGGFAITYLARDAQFNDRCVIKELAIDQLMVRSGIAMVPLPGCADEMGVWIQKVQNEALTLHKLRNAGVVQVRATWREHGTAYFAMDYVEGIEFPAAPMPGVSWATWEPVAAKFLVALSAIHQAGLIHGDIKPQNILIRRDGNPVIIDFGTARSEGDAKKTRLTTLAMTPGYCPPELAVRDRAREMGPWSDLYSWALTVMGLVIRHRGIDGSPLEASARVALEQHGVKHAGIGAETESALLEAGMSEGWVQALMACVAIKPGDRPRSAQEVTAMIDKWEPRAGDARMMPSPKIPDAPAAAAKPEPIEPVRRARVPAAFKPTPQTDDELDPELPSRNERDPLLPPSILSQALGWTIILATLAFAVFVLVKWASGPP
jgi:serine/threonine-protein kinase